MKSKVGFNVGVRGELDFKEASKGLFLDASVLFDAKNYKSDGYYDVTAKTSSVWDYNTYGITVPIKLVCRSWSIPQLRHWRVKQRDYNSDKFMNCINSGLDL